MLFVGQRFQTRFTKPANWEEHVFRYCDFKQIHTDGGSVDSAFLNCTFEECDWYWGLFNLTILVNVTFTKCRFAGTAFAGAKFVECEFHDCEFVKDNLNSDCDFKDVQWYNCVQTNCKGLEGEFRSKR